MATQGCDDCNEKIEKLAVPEQTRESFFHHAKDKGFWDVVQPMGVDVFNLVTNPSFETAVTNWITPAPFAISTAILRVVGTGASGGAFLRVTQTIAVPPIYGVVHNVTAAVAVGQTLYASAWVRQTSRGIVNLRLFPTVAGFAGNPSANTPIIASADWQRVSVRVTNTTAAPLLFSIAVSQVNGAIGSTFDLDAVLSTSSGDVEFFDGNSPGAIWSGAPHLSTSFMTRFNASYGNPVNLNEIGLSATNQAGFGLPPTELITNTFARLDGAHLQRIKRLPRILNFTGYFGVGFREIKAARKSVLAALRYRFRLQCTQESKLLYVLRNDCGCALTSPVSILAAYSTGMEGLWDAVDKERATLQFIANTDVHFAEENEQSTTVTIGNSAGALAQAVNINYTGTADAWLTIEMIASAANPLGMFSIVNNTTGIAVNFTAFAPPAGQYAILTTNPRAIDMRIYPANTRIMFNIVYPSSQPGLLRLVPGLNTITITTFVSVTGGTVKLRWKNTYESVDDVPLLTRPNCN